MFKKTTSIIVVLTLVITAFAIMPFSNVSASTPEQIVQAIEDGMTYLVSQQNSITGSWGDAPYTGFALVKLQERAYELGLDPFETDPLEPDYYEYADEVILGWQFLLGYSGGTNIGTYFWKQTDGISVQNQDYYTGICLMTLEATGDPNRENDGGLDFDGDGNVDTYGYIAQEVTNWLVWAQIDSGTQTGAWGYSANSGGDNSVTGYALLGLAAAEAFGCTVPASTRTKLNTWIDYVQNDPGIADDGGEPTPDGGSGYTSGSNWVNELKTGNLIFEMGFYGDATTSTRFQNAMDYIERHWQDINLQPGWNEYELDDDGDGLTDEDPHDYMDNDGDGLIDEDCGMTHFQAMYCLMKGLEYNGIDLIDHDYDGTSDHDWYQEFATIIVNQQNVDGSWPSSPCYVWTGGSWGTMSGTVLSTVWALLVLEKITPVLNEPPVADPDGPYSVDEGSTVTLTGSGSYDLDGTIVLYEWDLDNDGQYDDATGVTTIFSGIDDGDYTVGLRVTDDGGKTDTASTTVTVNNVAPTITSFTVTPGLVAVGDTVTLDATFTDPGTLDTHTAEIDWDNDGTYDETIPVTSPITATHSYTEAGVYTVKLKVTDDDSGFDTEIFQYVVVYDPNDGFVTGGGWINSPAGAYPADPYLEGTANFGFVSKYKKGQSTPTGSTEFQYQIGDINFHSSEYDWLVIANHKAIYKGTGTINGAGNYGFMISVIDEKLTPSTDDDMFRIKIWDKDNGDAVVYDNGLGDPVDSDPTTIIAGGQIVIHKK